MTSVTAGSFAGRAVPRRTTAVRSSSLTATPAGDTSFARWTGACVRNGSALRRRGRPSRDGRRRFLGEPVDVAVTTGGPGAVYSDPSRLACGPVSSAASRRRGRDRCAAACRSRRVPRSGLGRLLCQCPSDDVPALDLRTCGGDGGLRAHRAMGGAASALARGPGRARGESSTGPCVSTGLRLVLRGRLARHAQGRARIRVGRRLRGPGRRLLASRRPTTTGGRRCTTNARWARRFPPAHHQRFIRAGEGRYGVNVTVSGRGLVVGGRTIRCGASGKVASTLEAHTGRASAWCGESRPRQTKRFVRGRVLWGRSDALHDLVTRPKIVIAAFRRRHWVRRRSAEEERTKGRLLAVLTLLGVLITVLAGGRAGLLLRSDRGYGPVLESRRLRSLARQSFPRIRYRDHLVHNGVPREEAAKEPICLGAEIRFGSQVEDFAVSACR